MCVWEKNPSTSALESKMRRMRIVHAAIGLSGALTMSCSSYMPIADDDFVILRVEGQRTPRDGEDQQYNALAAACFRKIEGGDFCGQRVISEGHDPDEIMLGDTPLELLSIDNSVSLGINHSIYGTNLVSALPEEEFEFTVNDYGCSTLSMPSRLTIDLDVAESIISVSTSAGISLAWHPPPKPELPDKIEWRVEVGTEDKPCLTAEFNSIGGEIEDKGSTIISTDLLPKNLPPGGCTTRISVSRIRYGRLDPGIKHGEIRGQQTDRREVVLKP